MNKINLLTEKKCLRHYHILLNESEIIKKYVVKYDNAQTYNEKHKYCYESLMSYLENKYNFYENFNDEREFDEETVSMQILMIYNEGLNLSILNFKGN